MFYYRVIFLYCTHHIHVQLNAVMFFLYLQILSLWFHVHVYILCNYYFVGIVLLIVTGIMFDTLSMFLCNPNFKLR